MFERFLRLRRLRNFGATSLTIVALLAIGTTDRVILDPAPFPSDPLAGALPELAPPDTDEGRIAEAEPPGTVACDPKLAITPAPQATIRATVEARCWPNEVFTIHVGPLTARAVTDASGSWRARLPAFDTRAELSIAFRDQRLSSETTVADADAYRHVALQWEGAQKGFIRATQETTHGTFTQVSDGQGPGFQVFSVDALPGPLPRVVRLVVEAPVTTQTCGTTFQARAFQSGPLKSLSPTDISVTMPDCDRTGDVLLLQNLFNDLRLAAL